MDTTARSTLDPGTRPGASAWAVRPILVRALPAVALLCAFVSVWIVQNSSFGLVHDSQIYLIQALARLHPDTFAQDIFLRYGSQDSYTVFSPLFAAAIRVLGAENAAAILTVTGHIAFYGVSALFARQFIPARFVWLGLALVCALPSFYGGGNKFALAEDFLTPRIFGEILVMAGLTAFLKKRFWLAGVLGIAAVLVHPLMASGGFVFALCTSITPPRVRAWVIVAGVVIGCCALAWMGMHGQQLRFDGEWIGMLWGLYYLWISQWTVVTWASVLVALTTLAAGVLVLERSEGRSICRAALITGVAGIAVTFVGADALQFVLVLQAQAWRWLWVTMLVVTLAAPFIVYRMWSLGALGRAAALLLIAAWLFSIEKYAIGVAVIALLVSIAATRVTRPLPDRAQRLIVFGAAGVLALALLYHIATARMFAETIPDWSLVPWVLRDIRAASRSGFLPYAVFLLICIAVYRFDSWKPRLAIATACAVMLAAIAPASVNEWSTRWYAPEYEAFSGWRELIPPHTEVMWFDQPTAVWLLLDRPSYLSGLQQASAVFSRPAAIAMKRRSNMIRSYTWSEPGAAWIKGTNELVSPAEIQARANEPIPLGPLCAAAPDLRFVVTQKNMQAEPLATLPPTVAKRYRDFKLYRCEPL